MANGESVDYKSLYFDAVALLRIFFKNGLDADSVVRGQIDGISDDAVIQPRDYAAKQTTDQRLLRTGYSENPTDEDQTCDCGRKLRARINVRNAESKAIFEILAIAFLLSL